MSYSPFRLVFLLLYVSACNNYEKENKIDVLLPIELIQKSMKERGDGLYIVGLDFHVGFLQQIGDTTWFIHSN